jgi:hypothetical protein
MATTSSVSTFGIARRRYFFSISIPGPAQRLGQAPDLVGQLLHAGTELHEPAVQSIAAVADLLGDGDESGTQIGRLPGRLLVEDRGAQAPGTLGGEIDERVLDDVPEDVRVVELAEDVLQGLQVLDRRLGRRSARLRFGERLEQIAELLAEDARLVRGLLVGRRRDLRELAGERLDVLEEELGERAGERRLLGRREVELEAPQAPARATKEIVELVGRARTHRGVARLPLRLQAGAQPIEGPPPRGAERSALAAEPFDLHLGVAGGARGVGDCAELLAELVHRLAEARPMGLEEAAQAAERHAKIVHRLGLGRVVESPALGPRALEELEGLGTNAFLCGANHERVDRHRRRF